MKIGYGTKLVLILIGWLALAGSLVLASTAQAEKIFNAETFTLNNGLQVVVIPNHRAPVVSHMLWYKVGGADEAPGKSGLAHFLEHLMFKGTPNMPDGSFSKTIKRLGGSDNAFTAQDYTAYYQNVGKEHLPRVMEMEADRMRNLILGEDQVISERQVIIEERRQRIDNHPQARLNEQVLSALFVNHSYAVPTIGWMHEIKDLTREDALNFYKNWYRPDNAVLVVSGDVTASQLRKLAQKTYGKIPRGKKPITRERTRTAPLVGTHRIIIEDPQVGPPLLQKTYRAPRGSHALEIMAEILGGSSTSRLYRALVVDQKIAVSAGVDYDPVRLNDATLTIYATPNQETPVNELEIAIDQQIALLLEKGVHLEELKSAQDRKQAQATYFLDSLQGPAMLFGRALASGFDVDYIENWRSQIGKLSIDDINESADKVFAASNTPVIGLLLPLTQERKRDLQ